MRDIDVAPLPLSHLESHLDEVAIKRLHTSLTGAEALLEAALVALPFSGFLGIFVNAATGWPTPVPLLATLVVQGLLTLWIAGFRQRREG